MVEMLILPIVNKNRVLNVEVKLKKAEKVRSGVVLENTSESEVVVNGKKYSDSSYQKETDDTSVVDFIRNTSLLQRKDFLITTREESESNLYDVYAVSQPLPTVNPALDNLYANVITDMRKEIPGVRRGRYLSFEKLGMDRYLTDEKIAKLQGIVRGERDQSRWPQLFEQAGIADLPKTLDFVNMFDCTVISDTTIPEEMIQSTIQLMEPLQTKDYKSLKKYYEIAQSNREVYSRLSLVNKLIYDRPYELIRTKTQKQKQYVKVKENGENKQAA